MQRDRVIVVKKLPSKSYLENPELDCSYLAAIALEISPELDLLPLADSSKFRGDR